jgi:hypothetical protein
MQTNSNTGLPLMMRWLNYFSHSITHVGMRVYMECNCESTVENQVGFIYCTLQGTPVFIFRKKYNHAVQKMKLSLKIFQLKLCHEAYIPLSTLYAQKCFQNLAVLVHFM